MTYVLDTLAKYAPDIKPVVQDFTVPFYTEVTPSEFYQVQPTEVTFVSGGTWSAVQAARECERERDLSNSVSGC